MRPTIDAALSKRVTALIALFRSDGLFLKDDAWSRPTLQVATFSSVPAQSRLIYIFSRVYLYTFIALFIYVILSIFIAIIMDVYDVIKEYQKDSWPRCRVKDFYSRHYAASGGGCGDSPGMGRANASMTAGQNAEEQDPIYRFLNRFVRWLCCHGGSGAAFVADDHDEDVGPLVRSTATT